MLSNVEENLNIGIFFGRNAKKHNGSLCENQIWFHPFATWMGDS